MRRLPDLEPSPRRSGFTLIEILLVVVILGIISALVIAGVSDASVQTRMSTLKASLSQMRTQIHWYSAQHNSSYPTGDTLVAQLTGRSDAYGNLGATANLGPYLTTMPANPYNGMTNVKEIPAGAEMTADGSTGWMYQINQDSFIFKANIVGVDPFGVRFDSY